MMGLFRFFCFGSCCVFVFFFFKQKTAYEMRISDWSSDVALPIYGIEAEVQGREKHPYSIWRKMAERHVSFEQLSDVMAFRAVVGNVEDCYRTHGLIHQRWPMVPGRFKDVISTPKRTGSRSLHTSVLPDEPMRLEPQIRPHAMPPTAENGLAPHRAYKERERPAK